MMLSIVVPVLNEAESLRALHGEIDAAVRSAGIEAEVVFVDDGSTDGSWPLIEMLAVEDARVSGIRFRRNFGKAAALSAGMDQAKGDLVLMMDADLQDDPAEIPRLLEQIAAGYDVVNGWKRQRLDPWHKVFPSRVFNLMVSWLTGVNLHDHNCGLKMFRHDVAKEIRLYGELHRFIPVLAAARGFKVTELEINHRPRKFGQSKYGIRRFMRGFLDLLTVKFITGFGQRPQHVLGGLGLFFLALGGLGLLYLALSWLAMNVLPLGLTATPIRDRPLLIYSLAGLLLGGQLFSAGLIAELVVAYTLRDQDAYSIKATCGKGKVES
jgi:glycosyltransferase involved in cell wall biosynthesis